MESFGASIRNSAEAKALVNPSSLIDEIDQILFVLTVAHDELGVDWLTSHQISQALLDGYRVDVPRQRVQSLLDSNRKLALGRRAKGRRHYRILDEGQRRIVSARNTAVLFIQPEHALTGIREVQELLATRTGTIRICDPYLAPRSLDFLASLKSAAGIRVLTHQIQQEAALKRDLKPLRLQLSAPVEIRRLAARLLHDRYLIDDSEMIILGTSLNGLGLKQSIVVKVGADLRSTVLSEFDELWSQASAI
ncbi:MAG: hypothetical protein OXH53_09470 [bacterium]|nr:hypothetical protein [bacterium]